jgi:hypothetical protein
MLLPCTWEVPVSICVRTPAVLTGFISVGFEVLNGGGYEKFFLLGCNAIHSIESQLTFQRNMSLPSSGSTNKQAEPCLLRASHWFLDWLIL